MSVEVLCLRPRADFERAEVLPPASLNVVYRGPTMRRVLFAPQIAGVTRQLAAFLYRAAGRNVERVAVAGGPPLNRLY
jgi:hypothetical protein